MSFNEYQSAKYWQDQRTAAAARNTRKDIKEKVMNAFITVSMLSALTLAYCIVGYLENA